MYKKKKSHSILLFFTSMFLTIFIFGGGVLLLFCDSIEPEAVNIAPTENQNIRLLFCETDNNLSYEINLDFDKNILNVKRLEFDNSIYHQKGLSGAQKRAESITGNFSGAIFVTETQAASLVDYSGGYPCDVGEHVSSLCGDIGLGYRTLAGINVISIFKSEKNNRELCLEIVEAVTLNWCKILDEPRNYFKLLDLTTNNLSYTNYLPISQNFTAFSG